VARKKGICTICGKGGQLTFEHVPPDGSGNIHGLTMHTLEEWLERDSLDAPLPGGRLQPEGTGRFALCDPCNRRLLGTEYVPSFIAFVNAGYELLASIGPDGLAGLDAGLINETPTATFIAINRRRVAKQIVSMILVTCGRNFVAAHPDLERYVRHPEWTDVPAKYRLFLALTPGPKARFSPVTVSLDLATRRIVSYAEVAYPPFQYLFVVQGEPDRAGEITSWMHAADAIDEVSVVLPLGFCHTGLPGDLRSRAQAERDRDLNRGTGEESTS
jgi:hypothetical protein